MKKYLFLGLAAAAMLASCSRDETVATVPQNAIGFSSFIDNATKATDVTTANLTAFEVYGWRGDVQIFNAQAVEAKAGVCTYTPIQYWEAGYTYAFEAVAPKSGESGVTFAAAKDGGKVTFTNNATTDLLYAKAADVKMPEKITAQPDAVALTFKHMLSRIKFTFVNAFPENAAATLTFENVEVSNAYKTGETSALGTNAIAWTVSDPTLAVTFAPATEKALTEIAAGNKTGETAPMYFIPNATAYEFHISFDVTLKQSNAETTYEHQDIKLNIAFEPGKSYNLVAKIDNTNVDPENETYPIVFSASVEEWADYTDQVFKQPDTTSGN